MGVEQEERLQGKGMWHCGHCNGARTHSRRLQQESWRPCCFPGGLKIKYIPGKDLIAQMKSELNQLLATKSLALEKPDCVQALHPKCPGKAVVSRKKAGLGIQPKAATEPTAAWGMLPGKE